MKLAALPIQLVLTLSFLGIGHLALSAEIDQFTGSRFNVNDSSEFIDQKVNLSLSKAIQETNQASDFCNEKLLYKKATKYLNNHLWGTIIGEIESDPRIEKKPVSYKESIYNNFSLQEGFILVSTGRKGGKLSLGQEIRVGSYDIGIDKIEHLFQLGYSYFEAYRFKNKDIFTVLKDGELFERLVYGGNVLETGVFSYADLAANFNGLRFWNDLLKMKADPLGRELTAAVSCQDKKWVLNRQVTLSDYIDDSWNETINCSIYLSASARKKVINSLRSMNMTCPTNHQKFSSMVQKYVKINSQVINTRPEMLYDLDNHPFADWAAVPADIKAVVDPMYKGLQYNTQKTFYRSFRYRLQYPRQDVYAILAWDKVKLKSNISNQQKYCWMAFATGGDCKTPYPKANDFRVNGELDLLEYIRTTSRVKGMFLANQVLSLSLENYSSQSIELKKRILQTTKNKNFVFQDSLITIPAEERSEIALFMVLGIGGDDSPNAALIRKASEETRRMGFYSEKLNVDPNLGSDHNARMIYQMLKDKLPKYKKIGFVVASKGASDVIKYMLDYGTLISDEDREKFQIVTSLNGVIRSSYVAQYLVTAKRPMAFAVSSYLQLSGKNEMMAGIKSLAQDVWRGHSPSKIKSLFPNLKWVSFASMPETPQGMTAMSLWAGPLQEPVFGWASKASPGDGLVETAAAILPPGTGIQQFVIPVYGPHEMALGHYLDKTRVAPLSQGKVNDKVFPESGIEILNAVLRAFPKSLLN